jgi:lysophospholipase L1-like esterase
MAVDSADGRFDDLVGLVAERDRMTRIVVICLLVVAATGNCEQCGKQVDKMVSEMQTAVATFVPPPAPARGLSYLAMGDSVPAGQDLGGSCPHGKGRDCPISYPSLLAQQARLTYDSALSYTDVTCSGATTSNFLKDGQCKFESPQIELIDKRYSWVSITIGADDLMDWVKANQICVSELGGADQCDLYDKVLKPFEVNFRKILEAAVDHSDIVVVTQYYHVFSPSAIEPYNWIAGVNGGIDLVDDSIASVAGEFGSKVLVVDLRPVFATHEWGDRDSYVAGRLDCGIRIDCALVPGVHPNLAGQQAIATALWNELQQHVAQ